MLNFKRLKELTKTDIQEMAKEARSIGCSTYRLFALEVIDKKQLESFTFNPLVTNETGIPLWVVDAPFASSIINKKTEGLTGANLIDSSTKAIFSRYIELLGLENEMQHYFLDHASIMNFFTGYVGCEFSATLIYCYMGQSLEFSVFMERYADLLNPLPESDLLISVLESINTILFYKQKVLH